MDTIEDFYGLFNTYITFGKYFDVSQLTFRNEGRVDINIDLIIAQLSFLYTSFNQTSFGSAISLVYEDHDQIRTYMQNTKPLEI